MGWGHQTRLCRSSCVMLPLPTTCAASSHAPKPLDLPAFTASQTSGSRRQVQLSLTGRVTLCTGIQTAGSSALLLVQYAASVGSLYSAQRHCFCVPAVQVVRREGPAALWKGNLVTILHRLPYSSINFYTYERTQKLLQQTLPGTTDFARAWMSGATAGLVACSAVSKAYDTAQYSAAQVDSAGRTQPPTAGLAT